MTKLEPIVKQIRDRFSEARNKAASEVNTAMLQAYWDIGRIIVEHEQDGEIKAQYRQQLLTELAKELTKSVGRGFSKSNLYNMRNFYLEYQIFQTVSGKLTWSHYCELLNINTNKNKRLYLRFSLIILLICYINIRNFYLEYQICQTVSGKLSWSHYCELFGLNTLRIKSQRITRRNTDKNKRLYSCKLWTKIGEPDAR